MTRSLDLSLRVPMRAGLDPDLVTTGMFAINSPAKLASIINFTKPDFMVKGNNASGMLDLVAGNNMSAVGSPAQQVVSPYFNDTCVEFSQASSDAMTLPSGALFDPGVGSLAWLLVAEMVTVHPFNTYSIMSKIDQASPFRGHEVLGQSTSNGIRQALTNPSFSINRTQNPLPEVAYPGPLVVGSVLDLSDPGFEMKNIIGGKGSVVRNLLGSDHSTASVVRLGDSRGIGSAHMRVAMFAIWNLTNAEGFGQAQVDALHTNLGL